MSEDAWRICATCQHKTTAIDAEPCASCIPVTPTRMNRWTGAALSAPAAPVAQEGAIKLQGVKETIANRGGFWAPCTGCHEHHEGYARGAFSHVLGCHLGNGCSECGGIGAIWHTTDYDAMASAMMAADATPSPAPASQPVSEPAAPRAPLTDEQIAAVFGWQPGCGPLGSEARIARAIERVCAEAWGVKLEGGAA